MAIDDYTPGEKRLIDAFGYGHLCTLIDSPPPLYRMCVEKAFIDKMEGTHVEALRRVYRAIMLCTTYRHTDEFEKLTEFETNI